MQTNTEKEFISKLRYLPTNRARERERVHWLVCEQTHRRTRVPIAAKMRIKAAARCLFIAFNLREMHRAALEECQKLPRWWWKMGNCSASKAHRTRPHRNYEFFLATWWHLYLLQMCVFSSHLSRNALENYIYKYVERSQRKMCRSPNIVIASHPPIHTLNHFTLWFAI